MAEKTGSPKIDKLIEDFQDELIEGFSPSLPVRRLAQNPELAERLCNVVATQFARFAREHDLAAESLSEEGWLASGPDDFGYTDRPILGADQHDITYIDDSDTGKTYLVDFTAAQYGYQEFPMVLQEVAEDTFERDF